MSDAGVQVFLRSIIGHLRPLVFRDPDATEYRLPDMVNIFSEEYKRIQFEKQSVEEELAKARNEIAIAEGTIRDLSLELAAVRYKAIANKFSLCKRRKLRNNFYCVLTEASAVHSPKS